MASEPPTAPPGQAGAGSGAEVDSARRLGRFRLGERIAAGGMATVYRASAVAADDALAGHDLAIKVLHDHLADDDEFVRMFRDEGRIATRLVHPNIVRVYEIGDHERSHFLVMERVDGRSLAKVLDALSGGRKQMPRAAAIAIVREMLVALEHVHTLTGRGGRHLGLVHRDISPHNILLASDERVLLTDFGIARGEHRSDRTRTGTIKGKLHYMSPEQARGSRVDHRSDLYALGVVAYEMLTNRILLGSEATLALQARVASGRIDLDEAALGRLPEDLRAWLVRSLQPERDQRFADAKSMLQALDATRAANSARFKPGTLLRLLEQADPAVAAPVPQMLFRPDELSKPRVTPQPVPLPEGMVLTPQRPISGVFVGLGASAGGAVVDLASRRPSARRAAVAAAAGPAASATASAAATAANAAAAAASADVPNAAAKAGRKATKGPRKHTNPVLAAEAAARRKNRSRFADRGDDDAEAVRRSEVISLRAAGVDVDAQGEVDARGDAAPPAAAEGAQTREATRLRVQTERRVAVAGLVAWGCVAFLLFATLLEVWNARLELPSVDEASFVAMRERLVGGLVGGDVAVATRGGDVGRDRALAEGRDAAVAAVAGATPPARQSAASPADEAAPTAQRPSAPVAIEVRNDRFLPRGVDPPPDPAAAATPPPAPAAKPR